MSVQAMQATVYAGGGRRWFTRKAAERAEAKAAIRRRCECEKPDPIMHPGYPGSTCYYHAMKPERYQRLIRLYVAMFVRPDTAAPGPVGDEQEGRDG